MKMQDLGQPIYSPSTDTIFQLVDYSPSEAAASLA